MTHWASSCQNGHGLSKSTRKYRKKVVDVRDSRRGLKKDTTALLTLSNSQLQSETVPDNLLVPLPPVFSSPPRLERKERGEEDALDNGYPDSNEQI